MMKSEEIRLSKFADVIEEDTLIGMFDEFHKSITGRSGYYVSENGRGVSVTEDDAWWKFRRDLILSCKRGMIQVG